MMRPEQLSEMQLDALREVGSIGAGHAATALSQLLGQKVDLAVPTLQLVPIGEVPAIFGGPETLVAAVYTRLLGDLGGSILLAAPRASSLALVDMLRNRPSGTTKSFGRGEQALITHISSVLSSAYLASIGRLADLSLMPAPPSFALDMAGAILEAVTLEVGMRADAALLVVTRFFEQESPIDVHLFFMPDPESLEVLLGRLGMT
jgi:chemotaxis protein CheC